MFVQNSTCNRSQATDTRVSNRMSTANSCVSSPVSSRTEDPILHSLINQLEESGFRMDLSELSAEVQPATPISTVIASLNDSNNSFYQMDSEYVTDTALSNYYENQHTEYHRQSPEDAEYCRQSPMDSHYGHGSYGQPSGFYGNAMCSTEFPNQYMTHPEYDGIEFHDMCGGWSSSSITCQSSSLHSDKSDSLSDSDSVELEDHDLSQLDPSSFDIRSSTSFHTCRQPSSYESNEYGQVPIYSTPDNRHALPNFSELSKSIKMSKRGRPCTYLKRGCGFGSGDEEDSEDDYISCVSSPTSKGRRGAKNVLLWKFLLDELRASGEGQGYIKWLNKSEGTFRFVDTQEISKLWGQKKKKTDMNFEKLSRGIRHYYRDGLMSRLEGTRLVYKFNWERVPKAYRV